MGMCFHWLVLNLCALLTMKQLPVNSQPWFITSITHVWGTILPSPQFQLLHQWITYNKVSLLTEWRFFCTGSGGSNLTWLVNLTMFGFIMVCVCVRAAFALQMLLINNLQKHELCSVLDLHLMLILLEFMVYVIGFFHSYQEDPPHPPQHKFCLI